MADSWHQLLDSAPAHQREVQVDTHRSRLQLPQPCVLVVSENHRHFPSRLNAALPHGQVKSRCLVFGFVESS